jgi:hypothetical protein
MEHVDDVALVLQRVWAALCPGASYRFVCPNYTFPYEPHFAIPTLLSKRLTERMFHRRILASPTVVDPGGTWTSLNWISVASVRQIAREAFAVEPEFDQAMMHRYVHRAMDDASFQRRHSPFVRRLLTLLDTVSAFKLIPVSIQPVMSCRLERPQRRTRS